MQIETQRCPQFNTGTATHPDSRQITNSALLGLSNKYRPKNVLTAAHFPGSKTALQSMKTGSEPSLSDGGAKFTNERRQLGFDFKKTPSDLNRQAWERKG